MSVKFDPWNQFKNSEALKTIEVSEPPCKNCKFWSPRATTDSLGFYNGVILCVNSKDMEKDFSCYREVETDG